jgi:epoxyqueuosine reductase
VKESLKEKHTHFIKKISSSLGFEFCGISRAEKLVEEESQLEKWLNQGFHGKMTYMENHFDKRLDPAKLVPGAKSVISLLYNYSPGPEKERPKYKIAKYAYGKDYHFVIKDRLKYFLSLIREEAGPVDGRVFVDSAPVMERQWAAKGGVGWLGKNSLLINKNRGSYFFLAELIIDLDLVYDSPGKDYCGTCTRCIDACPTEALLGDGLLDASKCISYLTIELKDQIPAEFIGKTEGWVFGCDICQDVCPWNRFSQKHREAAFNKTEGIRKVMFEGETEFTEEVFGKIFKDSPVKRTKYEGLMRNIKFAKKKPADGQV